MSRRTPGDRRRLQWHLSWPGIIAPLVIALAGLVVLFLSLLAGLGDWLSWAMFLAGTGFGTMAVVYTIKQIGARRTLLIMRSRASAWQAVVAPLGVATTDGTHQLSSVGIWSLRQPGMVPLFLPERRDNPVVGLAVSLTREVVDGQPVLVMAGQVNDPEAVAAIASGKVWPGIEMAFDCRRHTDAAGVITFSSGEISAVALLEEPAWPHLGIWLTGW